MLLWRNALGIFYLPRCHLALYAACLCRCLLLPDEGCLAVSLLLDGTVDDDVGLGNTLKPQLAGLVLPVQPDALEVVGVVFHHELLIGVFPAPLYIGHSRLTHHLIHSLLALHSYLYAAARERAHPLARYPEHVYHVARRYYWRFGVLALLVHLHALLSGCRMSHLVPLCPRFQVGCFQFVVGVQLVLVGLYVLHVRTRAVFLGCDVLTGKTPVLMKYLLLEPAKHALYRLRGTIVGSSSPMDVAELVKELLVLQLLVAALVVMNYLVGLVTAHLNGHSVSHILSLIVLVVADAEA